MRGFKIGKFAMAAAIVAIMCVPVSAAAAEKGEKDKAPANAAMINGDDGFAPAPGRSPGVGV